MKGVVLKQAPSPLRGTLLLPGDKSIAHRALIISSLSEKKVVIKNFPANEDCFSTLRTLRNLGIKIAYRKSNSSVTVWGGGLRGLRRPNRPLAIGESGTTFRLLLGVLAGQNFTATLTTGKSLSARPMRRVTGPLRLMGAIISPRRTTHDTQHKEEYPPITIKGGILKGITYKMPVASAQVKSAILLAGLFARGKTKVIEPVKTRDHTEAMLQLFGAHIRRTAETLVIQKVGRLKAPEQIYIPGDISSASFFLVLGCIIPGSQITIKKIGLNASRAGILKVLKRMGADIKVTQTQRHKDTRYEPMGDVRVRSRMLHATTVKKEEIPSLIDELPVLMVAASCAEGRSVFEGVSELRVKETDRLRSMSENLNRMGAEIKITSAGRRENLVIEGPKVLAGAKVKSFGDHRTAMSMIIAGLKAAGRTAIDDVSCIDKSFPGFLHVLKKLM